ncbi:hypothetical protein M1512_02700 [Patescibacteria group bacterium]|nr:hypothetical protein [Patescibacteria group bacterium]
MKSVKRLHLARNTITSLSALALLTIGILPAVIAPDTAIAATVTSRSVSMSASAPGASATYTIQWTPASTTGIAQVNVAFCSNDPLVNDTTCTVPTGFSITSSPTASESGGLTPGSGCSWTASSPNSATANNVLQLAYSGSGCTTLTQSTSTADTISLSSVTNPTTTCSSYGACTFYARIYTYSTATTYSAGSLTNVVDDGGVAMSTATEITLNATVQEELSFCVWSDNPTSNSCGASNTVTIGHTVGSSTVLDDTAVDTAPFDFELGTNASHGVTVSVLGDTLTNGSYTIPADTTDAQICAGQTSGGDFGLWVSTLPSGMTVSSGYTATTTTPCQEYNLGSTATTTSEVVSTSAPINNATGTITYGATAQPTTVPGVYTANNQLIATGTF